MSARGLFPSKIRRSALTRGISLLALAVAAGIGPITPAQAQTEWTGAISNDWFVPGNWTGGLPGSFLDTTVNGTSRPPVIVGGGQAETGFLVVGQFGPGALTIEDGALSAYHVAIGMDGGDGTIIVTGPNSALTSSTAITLGLTGSGVLEIRDGAAVTSLYGTIGDETNSFGTVTVDAATWTTTGAGMNIGYAGEGHFTVSGGGFIDNERATLGYYAGSSGSLTITGAGSTWLDGGDMYVGGLFGGSGNLEVSDGGFLQVSNSLFVGYGGVGTASVSGEDTSVSVWGGLSVGGSLGGTFTVGDGAKVESQWGIIEAATGQGVATITGDGSTWTMSDFGGGLTIGLEGSGALTVTDGARVQVDELYIALRDSADGTLVISDGGQVSANYVMMSGDPDTTGALRVESGGVLRAAQVQRYDGVGTVTFDGGTLRLAAAQAFLFDGFQIGDLILEAGGGTIDTQGYNVDTDLAFAGSGGLTKTGTGTLQFWVAANTYAGTTLIEQGTLRARAANVFSAASTHEISTGASLRLDNRNQTIGGLAGSGSVVLGNATLTTGANDASTTFGGVISGGGSLIKTGTGTLTLTGANTYTGATTVRAGTLAVDGGVIAPSGSDITIGSQASDSAAFTLAGGGRVSVSGDVVVAQDASATGVLNIGGGFDGSGNPLAPMVAGTLDAGTLSFGAGSGTLNFNHTGNADGSDHEFTAVIASGAGTASINQIAGTTVLTADSSAFAGTTTISGGTLVIAGALGGDVRLEGGTLNVQGTLSAALAISAGSRIGGNGTFGTVVVADGGIVAPGNSIGTLTLTGDLVLNQASELHYDLGAPGTLAAPGASDRIVVGGNLVLDGKLHLFDDGGAGIGHYRLLTYAGSLTDNILDVLTPGVVANATYRIQAGDGNVDLIVASAGGGAGGGGGGGGAGPVPGDPQLQYWAHAGTRWTATGTQWRNSGGNSDVAWAGNHGVFEGGGATIAVEGVQGFAGLQFVTGPYVLAGPGALQTVEGGSELRVLAGETATIATAITGAGGLDKTGAGRLTLSGVNSYTGATGVHAGALDVAGTLVSAVTVHAGGTLGGVGTIGGLSLNQGGTLSPGHSIGTLNVAGDAIFNPGSVFRVEVEAPGLADRLAVAGTATINGGAVEIVKLSPEVSYQGGQSYRLLDAASVVRNADFSFDNPFLFTTSELRYGADHVDLVLTAGAAGQGFDSAADTFDQVQVATALSGLAQNGDALAVYNELLSITDVDQARRAFDLSSGEVHAAGQHVLDQTFALFARNLRQQALAGIVAFDAIPTAHGAWLAPLGGRGTVEADGNGAGLEYWAAGLTGGYAGAAPLAGGTAHAGLSLAYIRSHGAVDARLSALDADGFYAGAYGGWSDGSWTLAGSLAYAANAVATERRIAFGGIDRIARADYWTHAFGFSGEAAYGFDIADGTTIAPLFSLDAGWSGQGGFAETGAGALDLMAASGSGARLDTGVGVTFEHVVLTENGKVTLSGRVVWEHAFADIVPRRSLALAGSPTPFAVHGADAGRDRLGLGAGLSIEAGEALTIDARYEGLFSGSQQNHAASIGFNAKF